MKFIFPPIAGFITALLGLFAPLYVWIPCLFIRWDNEPSLDHYGVGPAVIRGNLPTWLRWFQTPDECPPGGFYESTVLAVYEKYGRFICSWYWLGVRNQLMGLACWLGKPTTDYIPEGYGYWERDDIWRYACKLGPLKFVTGYQVYKVGNGFIAAPVFTIKSS